MEKTGRDPSLKDKKKKKRREIQGPLGSPLKPPFSLENLAALPGLLAGNGGYFTKD